MIPINSGPQVSGHILYNSLYNILQYKRTPSIQPFPTAWHQSCRIIISISHGRGVGGDGGLNPKHMTYYLIHIWQKTFWPEMKFKLNLVFVQKRNRFNFQITFSWPSAPPSFYLHNHGSLNCKTTRIRRPKILIGFSKQNKEGRQPLSLSHLCMMTMGKNLTKIISITILLDANWHFWKLFICFLLVLSKSKLTIGI